MHNVPRRPNLGKKIIYLLKTITKRWLRSSWKRISVTLLKNQKKLKFANFRGSGAQPQFSRFGPKHIFGHILTLIGVTAVVEGSLEAY